MPANLSRNLFLLGELMICWVDYLSTGACSLGYLVKAGINMNETWIQLFWTPVFTGVTTSCETVIDAKT
jgi:hypothetical protein